MSEQEVVRCVKNHLESCFRKPEGISKSDKKHCITMIKDFLPHMTKAEAECFFEEHILNGLELRSSEFLQVRYRDDGEAIFVVSKEENLKFDICKDNLVTFGKELIKLGKTYKNLIAKKGGEALGS